MNNIGFTIGLIISFPFILILLLIIMSFIAGELNSVIRDYNDYIYILILKLKKLNENFKKNIQKVTNYCKTMSKRN